MEVRAMIERRSFLTVAAVLAGHPDALLAQAFRRTPGQILGPYYPVRRPSERDADLTRVEGRATRAKGQVVQISGRVLTEAGDPVPNAEIEVWQADSRGHYAHPSDKSRGEVDPNFQGYAAFRSRSDGAYRFTTVKPAAYPDDGAAGMRAPHIHFQVTGRVNRLITQMYFPGDALNETDRVLAFAGANGLRLVARFEAPEPTAIVLQGEWDIILRDG